MGPGYETVMDPATVVWGALATCLALTVFHRIDYAQKAWSIMQAVLGSGMLGLMGLAFLPFRVDKWAAMTGFVLSYACLFVMMASSITFLLWPVIGNTVCFLVALLLHGLLASGKGDRTDHCPTG